MTSRPTIAIYGGSFNPPHVAHGMVIAWLLWTQQVDSVWIVPVFRHAFEGTHDKVLAPYDQRVAWCDALRQTVDPGRVVVSQIESQLPTPSYTIDTLTALSQAHPDHRFRLVVGADVLPQTPQWKDWASIEERHAPIVVGRQGYPCPEGAVVFPEVSSSAIRQALAAGEAVHHWVPARVLHLIQQSS